ncbi:sodium/hydrogen exchanger family protein [Paramyrothecium foliicola]|nr:sodium/hydrogen exchanger family protein [Paramyrothecium foliicola]
MSLTDVTNFNIVVSVCGGWIILFGALSHLIKHRLYLSEAVVSLFAGVLLTHAFKLLKPTEYAISKDAVSTITLEFSRLVLSIQVVLTAVQLPSRFPSTEWKSLGLMLGPGMIGMWACSSGIIWMLVPGLPFLHALAIGACVTPTDPVLSSAILKGKFAEENLPVELRNLLSAESGSNDGLGYPFLFLALYLIKYNIGEPGSDDKGLSAALKLYLGETCLYAVLLSIVYGVAVGLVTRKLLYWVEDKKLIDRESFLLFPFALAIFTLGTAGMIGCDDILACFVAGNAFAWNDWFRLKTVDDPMQHTIDMLLNMAMFIWLGAVCPWASFVSGKVLSLPSLIFLGILLVLFRRIPIMMAIYPSVKQIQGPGHAIFVGYFGPIGISAVFYIYVALDYLHTVTKSGDDVPREDATKLEDALLVVVWFSVVSSVVTHGLTLPCGKIIAQSYKKFKSRGESIRLP